MSPYHVSKLVPTALHCSSLHTVNLKGRSCFYPYPTDEETEAQSVLATSHIADPVVLGFNLVKTNA